MADEDRVRWDGRHADREPGPVGPPGLFAAYESAFPVAGHALDLACGQGEVSVWLAVRGLHVLGVDVSPVAIAAARELAVRNAVDGRCRFEVLDLDGGLPPGPPANVIVCNKFRDRRLDAAIVERLAPGGLLAISALSEVGAHPGPFRVAAGELEHAFADLDVLAASEADGQAWLLARRETAPN
ncbi:methyltransferase domain-containing protein [Mycobacterium sp. DL592]|uniref:class I SAM-dependent methyltransferase n=1 Tax=Mycobacterium sp. DL592 TaxID=2675524 RepID=UPI001422BBC3|nr:methyltransferase domain-containing protein [Mycobacterium sp. DL592]